MAFSYFLAKGSGFGLNGNRFGEAGSIQRISSMPFLSIHYLTISFEHPEASWVTHLGKLLLEKAGIIKSGAPIISGVTAGEQAKSN